MFAYLIKNQYLYTMTDERIIELYRSQLAAANEEKGMLYAQVKALTEEVSMLRLSIEQSKHDSLKQVKELLSELKTLHKEGKKKDKRIAELEEKLSDALLEKNWKNSSEMK